MKPLIFTLFIVFTVSIVLLSCTKTSMTIGNADGLKTSVTKSTTNSTKTAASDTSTTLIDNQTLVGNWQLLTDSVYQDKVDTVYHGDANDRYIFTKYGNMYIHSDFHKLIDTAVYTLTRDTVLNWTNYYISQMGGSAIGPSHSGYFDITSISAHQATLLQYVVGAFGPRWEELKLIK